MADSNATIGRGSRVTMHYRLSLTDGTEVDTTYGGEPFAFTLGEGEMLDALELPLHGLEAGASRQLQLTPEAAFGYADMDNVHTVPRSDFDPQLTLEPGVIIGFATPGGDEIPGTVVEVDAESVRVDFNHPLAGHDLIFNVEIIAVDDGPTEQGE